MSSVITHGNVRFIDLPEYFLERYCSEINMWSENLRKIGLVHQIFLREGYLAELSPDGELGAQMLCVKLRCRPWPVREGIEILPASERDRAVIARHVERLQAAKLPSNAFLPEPPRPWLPFVPDRVVKQ
jgi:hypothetical protein